MYGFNLNPNMNFESIYFVHETFNHTSPKVCFQCNTGLVKYPKYLRNYNTITLDISNEEIIVHDKSKSSPNTNRK